MGNVGAPGCYAERTTGLEPRSVNACLAEKMAA
jgi:hypothetical protein